MGALRFSLEVFPPKRPPAYAHLLQTLEELSAFEPEFMTVTYGAGGSTREQTKEIALEIASKSPFPVGAHLTCVGASRAEVNAIAEDYWHSGIRRIVALRGDPPNGQPYEAHPQGYAHASELVTGLKRLHDFDLSVAAYPEKHPESPSLERDLFYLKEKMDCGAERAITQFFFDPEVFLRFRDAADKIGIRRPIIPGLLPILDFERVKEFSRRCFVNVPSFLHEMFEGVDKLSVDHQLLSMNVLSHQVTRLSLEGVPAFHFYTLNETLLTKHMCRWLRVGF